MVSGELTYGLPTTAVTRAAKIPRLRFAARNSPKSGMEAATGTSRETFDLSLILVGANTMTQGYKPPVSTFLTAEDRENWYQKAFEFTIVGVQTGDGKYGKSHTYKLARVINKAGEVETRFISLSSNARREDEAAYVAEMLVEDSTGVGPVKLNKVPTANGQDAWIFDSPDA